MPTFGSDPESNDMGWTETSTGSRPRVFVSAPVRTLTTYFAYHKGMTMSQRCNDADKDVLNMLFSRKLKQGFTVEVLKDSIDRFFQSPAGRSVAPAQMFAKNDVQHSLLSESDVSRTDPVLQWLLDGMQDTSMFSDSDEVRKAVLLYCDDALLRYPEVVADIIRIDDPYEYLCNRLTALEDLIYWNLEGFDCDVEELLNILGIVELPRELASSTRAPKSLRDKRETLKQAIVSIPIRRNKER